MEISKVYYDKDQMLGLGGCRALCWVHSSLSYEHQEALFPPVTDSVRAADLNLFQQNHLRKHLN